MAGLGAAMAAGSHNPTRVVAAPQHGCSARLYTALVLSHTGTGHGYIAGGARDRIVTGLGAAVAWWSRAAPDSG